MTTKVHGDIFLQLKAVLFQMSNEQDNQEHLMTSFPTIPAVSRPRTFCFILDLYEGLAIACEDLVQELRNAKTDRDPIQQELTRNQQLYKRRVGVEFSERQALREKALLEIGNTLKSAS